MIVRAKYRSHCPACGCDILVGDEITSATGEWLHTTCADPEYDSVKANIQRYETAVLAYGRDPADKLQLDEMNNQFNAGKEKTE